MPKTENSSISGSFGSPLTEAVQDQASCTASCIYDAFRMSSGLTKVDKKGTADGKSTRKADKKRTLNPRRDEMFDADRGVSKYKQGLGLWWEPRKMKKPAAEGQIFGAVSAVPRSRQRNYTRELAGWQLVETR
jgi:hypothetical protein